MDNTRAIILKVLTEINPDVDFERESELVDSGILNSFDIITFVSDIGEELDIDIPVEMIIPENFSTLDTIEKLIYKLLED